MSNPSQLNRLAAISIALVLFAATGLFITKSIHASNMMEIARATAERIPGEGRPNHSTALQWAGLLEATSLLACLTVLGLGSYGVLKTSESGKVWRSFTYSVIADICLLVLHFGILV